MYIQFVQHTYEHENFEILGVLNMLTENKCLPFQNKMQRRVIKHTMYILTTNM